MRFAFPPYYLSNGSNRWRRCESWLSRRLLAPGAARLRLDAARAMLIGPASSIGISTDGGPLAAGGMLIFAPAFFLLSIWSGVSPGNESGWKWGIPAKIPRPGEIAKSPSPPFPRCLMVWVSVAPVRPLGVRLRLDLFGRRGWATIEIPPPSSDSKSLFRRRNFHFRPTDIWSIRAFA